MKIKKGDTVKIIAGKDRGKEGRVIKVNPGEGKILVEKVNLFKKHQRPKKQGEKGETVTLPRFFSISNAMVICGSCLKPARVGYRAEEGNKVRYCKKCKAGI